MSNGMIEYLIMKAATNWKHHIRQTVNKKVLFLLGYPDCGKSSLGAAMIERWEDEKVLLIPEVGGDFRTLSASASEMFEVPFEFATLALEIANMSCITMEDFGNVPLIVDGGIIQDYVHLHLRTENIDERIRDMFSRLYIKLMVELFECLPNAYFLLIEHREKRNDVRRFEKTMLDILIFIQYSCLELREHFAILESNLATDYLLTNSNIPFFDDFFEGFGNFVRLKKDLS